MAEENSTGSNLIWAVTTIIVVALIVGALYVGFSKGLKKEEKISVDINVPASNK